MFFVNAKEGFISGNIAAVEGAKAVGANFMSGYPITPTTEILESWAKLSDDNPKKYKFIQSEDETSAGFNVIGAILGGACAFTATAGPGHILMQDPLTMAEAMRLPMVVVVMQRGGPSTGTVIFGQQEVTLASFGGNGEGLRIVYSISSPQDAYDYTAKAFRVAWKYKFPVIVLGDGYVAKMKSKVKMNKNSQCQCHEILTRDTNLRNCYNFENQLHEILTRNIDDYDLVSKKVAESEEYYCRDAELVLVAHGSISIVVKNAVVKLRSVNKKIGLFRPITLRPFDYHRLSQIASHAREIVIVESSNGHLERIVKDKLYGLTKIKTIKKPVMGISEEELIKLIG